MLTLYVDIYGRRGAFVSDVISFACDEHGQDPHRLVILSATDADWLERLAQTYRVLRTARRMPDPAPGQAPALAGIDVVDTTRLNRMLADTQIAKRSGGNFDVLRSDLAEVLLGHVGEHLGGFRYGYISVRDRESARQAGRGIDQVGVRLDPVGAVVHLMLGEAKVSSERASPPASSRRESGFTQQVSYEATHREGWDSREDYAVIQVLHRPRDPNTVRTRWFSVRRRGSQTRRAPLESTS